MISSSAPRHRLQSATAAPAQADAFDAVVSYDMNHILELPITLDYGSITAEDGEVRALHMAYVDRSRCSYTPDVSEFTLLTWYECLLGPVRVLWARQQPHPLRADAGGQALRLSDALVRDHYRQQQVAPLAG